MYDKVSKAETSLKDLPTTYILFERDHRPAKVKQKDGLIQIIDYCKLNIYNFATKGQFIQII